MMDVHIKYLEHFVELPGKVAVDVGCRDGELARLLAERQARPIGIRLGDGDGPPPDGAEGLRIEPGAPDRLPLGDASVDLVIYLFNFHHIPQDRQHDALLEARRVLRPHGRLHLVEPFSEGSFFELLRLIDDQSEPRAKALESIALAWSLDLKPIIAGSYIHVERFANFDDFRRRVIAVDPHREKAFAINERQVREAFAHHGIVEDDGRILFRQPCRMYHFARQDDADRAA